MSVSQELKSFLSPVHQEHLLEGFENLSKTEQEILAQEIRSQDFDFINHLYRKHSPSSEALPWEEFSFFPMPFSLAEEDSRREMWEETGNLLLERGEVAAFLVAGGQGSRLGFEGPKGAFDIGLPSGKSIFQIQAERLLHLSNRAGKPIPWCIMTSPLNHEATVEHFETHQFFGIPRESIRFFPQGMICALDENGKALKSSPEHLALVPDGNGGCFQALARSGTLAWLIEKGIRYVFLYGVDNILVKVCDPLFIGSLAGDTQSMSASKAVEKRTAEEKVGVFGYKNKKPAVIEYSDLPAELRDQKFPDETLAFNSGNIAIHLFRIEALKKLQSSPLPWHAARKTAFGHSNLWKFEQFLFDAFPILGSMKLFGVSRENEFAPVKNSNGNDSPYSARQMLGKLHRYWLQKSGVAVKKGKLYEISPRLSYAGEDLSPAVFERELGKDILEFDE